MDDRPVLALPKGRILDDVRPLFAKAGLDLPDPASRPRSLRFDDPELPVRVLLLRGHDVPTYVAQGAVDFGVAGLDVLLEHDSPLYAPLDLGIGLCWMCVIGLPWEGAGAGEAWDPRRVAAGRPLRVATKFPRIARSFFDEQGVAVDVVHLHGNVELAPLCGLADCVVDLVSSGETLRRNRLVAYTRFLRITSRLVCNRASYRLRFDRIQPLVTSLRAELQRRRVGEKMA